MQLAKCTRQLNWLFFYSRMCYEFSVSEELMEIVLLLDTTIGFNVFNALMRENNIMRENKYLFSLSLQILFLQLLVFLL